MRMQSGAIDFEDCRVVSNFKIRSFTLQKLRGELHQRVPDIFERRPNRVRKSVVQIYVRRDHDQKEPVFESLTAAGCRCACADPQYCGPVGWPFSTGGSGYAGAGGHTIGRPGPEMSSPTAIPSRSSGNTGQGLARRALASM